MSSEQAREDARLSAAVDHLRSILIQGETLEAWAVQRRIFSLTHRRMLIGATSGRFVALERGMVGGFRMTDVRWQDLRDVKLRAGILAAELTLIMCDPADLSAGTGTGAVAGPCTLTYRGLRTEQAQQIYRLAQGHEQAWREKRRVRELEEMRARSGGVHIAPAPAMPAPTASGQPAANDTTARLNEAKNLLDAKLISDAEYEAVKARILGNL